MQPPTSAESRTPDRPLPIAKVAVAMTVADSTGEEIGTVTEVQMPGTGVRPDVPDPQARQLMANGYFRVDGGGVLSRGYYVDGEHVADVTTTDEQGIVSLAVPKDDLSTTH